MKVAYILHSTNMYGGASKSFVALLKGVMSRGVEPVVVVPDGNGLCQTFREMGIKAHVVNFRMAVYPKRRTPKDYALYLPRLVYQSLINITAAKKVGQIIKQEKPDIIHTNVSVVDIANRAAKSLGIPHIVHIREYGGLDFDLRYKPSYGRFLKYAKSPNVYTICITKDIQRHHRLAGASNSWVVYNGIGSVGSIALDKSKEDYFLYAGRIQRGKGLLELVNAYIKYAKACKGEKITPLHIYGEISASETDYYKSIQRAIAQNSMQNYIRYCGVSAHIAPVMQKAKAIVVPSKAEGFGRCMAEAMFNGCLCIGLDTAGTKEQFDNGLRLANREIGLRYNTEEELADCLGRAARFSIEEMMPYIAAAQQTVSTLYTNEANTAQVTDIYNRIRR